MSKRVVIVQQWGSGPEGDWYPWLAATLRGKGIRVDVPEMPDPSAPKVDEWVSALALAVGEVGLDTYFVGHSVGCQTILRYLATLPVGVRVGGVLLVAPWLRLREGSLGEEEIAVARPWLEEKIEWGLIRPRTNKFVVVMSENDPYVPLDNKELFESHLGARVLIQPLGGHFEKKDGFSEMHVALNELEKILR